MNYRIIIGAAVLPLLSASVHATPQESSPPPATESQQSSATIELPSPKKRAGDIIVTAPTTDANELKPQITAYVRQISNPVSQQQFARRSNKYCTKIIGLDQSYHRLVFDKINEAAQITGKLKENTEGCKPNLFVIFTENADDLTETLRRRIPILFYNKTKEELDTIFNSKRPVRWWYGKDVTDVDGMPIVPGDSRAARTSLISTGVKIDITSTVIIVDTTQANGYPLQSINSFIAMIAFSEVNYPSASIYNDNSVLGMFNSPKPRIEALRNLTVWDRAFLHALYKIHADREKNDQRRSIRSAMIDYIQQNSAPTP